MPDPIVATLHEWLRAHEDELLKDTVSVLQIDSIESEALPNAPYGAGNRRALDFMLGRAKDFGMATTDLEGYLGYAEFGQGERLVMTLGHLDVVPVSSGWKHQPFGAEIDNGYIYARGSNDDKGPTVASFYAMRAIKECIPDIPARMRMAFGCDEESGFGCVARYVQTEEAPTFGVAPDSGWPLYHAEKGIADFLVSVEIPMGEFEILEVCGGQRPNIVIDQCRARVRVGASIRAEVEAKVADKWDANVTARWNGDVLEIETKGKAAHGANPFVGDNAATRVFRFLTEIAPFQFSDFLTDVLKTGQTSGAGLGIEGWDEVSRDLTCNLGIVSTEASPNTQRPTPNALNLLFNIRYPVTWKGDDLARRCRAYLATLNGKFSMKIERDSPSLYFPLDHPLVKAVCDVYEEETGDKRAPGVMGGGTYARAVPNTVSIGTSWDGDGPAHENDERLAVESLFKSARIYAHLFYRLATMP